MFRRFRISSPLRVAIGISGLSCSLVLLVATLGVFPDGRQRLIEQRHGLAESIAIYFSSMASRADVAEIETSLTGVLDRNPSIQSIIVVDTNDRELVTVAQPERQNRNSTATPSAEDQVTVPILRSATETFGHLHVRFTPLRQAGVFADLLRPEYVLAWLFASVGLVIFYVYLRFVLRQLSPQRVVPKRVREALDTLAEGLLLLDKDERIVLANRSFEQATGLDRDALTGQQASEVPLLSGSSGVRNRHPWKTTLNEGTTIQGEILTMDHGNRLATYSVSSTAVVDDEGIRQGAIASFEDVTKLEEQRGHLRDMVSTLRESAYEIKRKNRELEYLATRDPLTGCLNRRSFFQKFDEHWNEIQKSKSHLSAFMVDIDHFKSINDNHGHAIGDEVLKLVGSVLGETIRAGDIVSRYGGEEFAVLLPDASIDNAGEIAEAIRNALEQLTFSVEGLRISASLGVSSVSLGPQSPQDLLEQADKCLYVAKRNGRNRVVRWDNVPDDIEVDESKIQRTPTDTSSTATIPYQAVTALISTLAYRDQATANHCRRVADWCVALGESLLTKTDCYVLEIAGLLHDIGKVGVPENILQKPGKLTKSEWSVLRNHEEMGIQIIKTSFANAQLTEMVAHHRKLFADGGSSLPVGSRILAIADAFDSMTSDQPYRLGISVQDACSELRRCAGIQFDPEFVELFIERVQLLEDQEKERSPGIVAKDVALSIGMHIEHLVAAIDDQNLEGIIAVATKLQAVANKYSASELSDKTQTIVDRLSDSECDEVSLLQSTSELLDLCRSTQASLLVPEPICPVLN